MKRAFLVEVANVECLGEVLPEVVGGPGLKRLPVSHHGFDRIGLIGAGETLRYRLAARNDGNGRLLFRKIDVNIEHLTRLGLGFLEGRVGRVSLLPVELQGSKEELGAKLPANDAVPLVDQNGKITIGLDPLRIGVTDDGFGSRTDYQGFLEFFPAAVSNDRQARGRIPRRAIVPSQ